MADNRIVICEQCQIEFLPIKRGQRFCSARCRGYVKRKRQAENHACQRCNRPTYTTRKICKDCTQRQNLWHRYGLTYDDYQALLIRQSGKCAICLSITPSMMSGRPIPVDHCHKTGIVRGLICGPCNRNLAWLEKNEIAIRNYLAGSHQWTAKDAERSFKTSLRTLFDWYRDHVQPAQSAPLAVPHTSHEI